MDDFANFLAITELVNRYAYAVDAKDWASLQSCFVDDATVVDYLGVEIQGSAAVVEFFKPMLLPYPTTQHIMATPRVTFDGDHAEGGVYLTGVHVQPGAEGGDTCVVGVRYDMTLNKVQDNWKIRTWRINPLWTLGNKGILPGA